MKQSKKDFNERIRNARIDMNFNADEDEQVEESDIKEIAPNTYIANSIMRLDEFAEFFDIDEDKIDDEDIDTIGGLVLKILGRLAQVNDTVKFGNLTFIVKELDGARITKLEIIKEETSEEKVEENNN